MVSEWLSTWLIATVAISVLISGILLRQLAHPDVKFPALLVVLLSWSLSLTVVWVAPLDLDMGQIEPELLTPVWMVAYWTTSLLTWLIIPIQQAYYDSGHFNWRDKLREAIRSNLQFYVYAGVLIAAVAVAVAVTSGLAAANLLTLAMALANIWGLFLMVVLLGYGLVDIPRKLWNFGNTQLRARALYFQAVAIHDEYQDSTELISDTISMVEMASTKVKNLDDEKLTSYMDIIEAACPQHDSISTVNEFIPSDLAAELRDNPITEHLLAKLHYRVKKDYHENRRAEFEWNSLLDRLKQIETEEAAKISNYAIHRTFRGIFNLHVLARLLSAILWIVTFAVIWCEITLSIDVRYSIFYVVIQKFNSPPVTYMVGLILISYLAMCAFYSMFRLRLSSFYHLHFGGHSEANSLLFNASFILRLIFPLGINFFSTTLLDRGATTSFETAVGQMNVVPVLGQKFNLFVPVVISVLCLVTGCNLYGRLLRLLQISQFEENGPGSDQIVAEGESLVRRQRRKRARNIISNRTVAGGYLQLGQSHGSP
uniref:LMBR1-like membrane protein n=1 Tax=Spongospora subterranea TaxID=70186 RepID=A0A0H5R8Y2_9EUKA|eukprot:CRZ10580.1 hypothetical protein [Spongospora subterranea]